MALCSGCGRRNRRGVRFCTACGSAVGEGNPWRRRRVFRGLAAATVAVVAGISVASVVLGGTAGGDRGRPADAQPAAAPATAGDPEREELPAMRQVSHAVVGFTAEVPEGWQQVDAGEGIGFFDADTSSDGTFHGAEVGVEVVLEDAPETDLDRWIVDRRSAFDGYTLVAVEWTSVDRTSAVRHAYELTFEQTPLHVVEYVLVHPEREGKVLRVSAFTSLPRLPDTNAVLAHVLGSVRLAAADAA